MAGLRRFILVACAAFLPVAALFAPAFVSAAVATTPGVGFTADALPTYQTNGIGWTAAEANGVVYVGGTFSAVRPPAAAPGQSETPATNFVALNAATGRPTACRLSFQGTGASVRALAVSPNRLTLYAGGRFTGVNSVPAHNLVAINLTTCTPVSGFRPSVSSWVRGLTVAPNGNVYAAGDFLTVNAKARQHFAAFSPTGALLSWAPNADHVGYAVAVTPDGVNVAIGGAFDRVNGADSHALAIVKATNGALVRGYPNHFVPVNSAVKSLAADASGIYTGNEGSGLGVFDGRIALNPLTFGQRWRDTCLGATQDVLIDGGNLYAASHAHDCSSMGGYPDGRRQHLNVESLTDPHFKVWWPDTNDGLGEGIGPRALVISSRSTHRYLFAVGDFTKVNGSPQQGILRLADSPDTGPPSPPTGLSASTTVAGPVQLLWRTGTDRDDRTLTYRVYRNGSATPIATLHGDSDWWRRPQVTYTDRSVRSGVFYTYRVTASDSSGNTSPVAPTVGVRSSTVPSP
jgi:hypothetical protein